MTDITLLIEKVLAKLERLFDTLGANKRLYFMDNSLRVLRCCQRQERFVNFFNFQ